MLDAMTPAGAFGFYAGLNLIAFGRSNLLHIINEVTSH